MPSSSRTRTGHVWFIVCTAVVAITDPEDVTITSLATEIADASVTCSTAEITSLKELEDDLETLEAAIDAAVEAIQKLLEGRSIIFY